MKEKSKAGEPAELWLRRKEAFCRIADPILRARAPFRDALSLDPGSNTTNLADDGSLSRDQKRKTNFSYRFMRWFRAQGASLPHIISTNRDASPDEYLGMAVDILLRRVLDEGKAEREWRQTYADLCWLGCSTVWYGYHAQIVDMESAQYAAESPGDAVARALSGDIDARPGQDRGLMAEALVAPARDEAEGVMMGSAGRSMLEDAALEQLAAGIEEDDLARDVRVKDRTIWFRHAVPGEDTFWDSVATDPADIEWMAQRVVMRVEEAREHPALIKSARKRLNGLSLDKVRQSESEKKSNPVPTASGVVGAENEERRVVLYVFWDKRHRTRHIISPELPKEYLEADETNPYVDENGDDAIPGFYPCALSIPELPPRAGPERVFGVPMVAPGWSAEQDADDFATMMVMDANKHARRDYVLHPDLENPEAVKDALRGPSGALIRAQGVDGSEIKNVIVPVQFTGSSGEIENQFAHAESRYVKATGMPYAELSSQPQAATATQEEIGIAAGRSEAKDMILQDNEAFATMVEGVRGLVKSFYTEEKVFALLGPNLAQQIGEWKSTSLDGDAVIVKSGALQQQEENVKISLTQKSIELALGYTGPMGLPIYDMRPMYEELFRLLGRGKPIEVAPEVMQMRQLVDTLVQEIERLKDEAAEAHAEGKREAQQKAAGNDKPGPKKSASGAKATPKRDTMNSGTRRGTSTA